MPDWTAILDALRAAGVNPDTASEPRPVAGGDISAAWRVDAGDTPVFVKTGPATSWAMFSAEAEGLAELAAADAVRVPAVLAAGQHSGTAYIALEWMTLGRSTGAADRRLGEQLAAMHRVTRDRHGWHRDNTIGLTPQHNDWVDDWIDFFRDRRLGFQLRLAAQNGYAGRLQEQGARLAKRLPVFFTDYQPAASLLHGDLWAGNRAVSDGEPVIFDPAGASRA